VRFSRWFKASNFLGAPYGDEEMTDADAHARKQAEVIAADIVKQGGPAGMQEKQAIALIAYLQRVGTDLFRSDDPKKSEAAPATDAPATEVPATDAAATEAAGSGNTSGYDGSAQLDIFIQH
jgi:cytochrome c oxidase cbb3-type subunit I/II